MGGSNRKSEQRRTEAITGAITVKMRMTTTTAMMMTTKDEFTFLSSLRNSKKMRNVVS